LSLRPLAIFFSTAAATLLGLSKVKHNCMHMHMFVYMFMFIYA